LQENEQALHLRCGHCGADWPSARLRCRQCGNEDHETQRFFYPEDKHNLLRVEACDLCKSYLKVVAAYSPTPAEMLVIEDLATIHLDCIAQEHGYERPASRGEMAP
jgi:FdhE protein